MSVSNIIDKTGLNAGKIDPKYIPTIVASVPPLNQVLAVGNSSGGQNIDAQGGNMLCDALKCTSIEPLAYPFTTGIAVGGNLNMIPTTKLIFDGNISLQNNYLGSGTDVIVDSIPSAGVALANVVSYDTASKKLYYQPAGGGGGGVVNSVVGGTNISVNSATPSAPIVSLRAPLTSTLDVGSQNITSSTGDINIVVNGANPLHIRQTGAGGEPMPIASYENTNANNRGVNIDLYKNSSAPNDNDSLGALSIHGNSSSGIKREYARIEGFIQDKTNTSEDGNLVFQTVVNGTMTSAMGINMSGISMVKPITMNNNNITQISTASASQIICPTIKSTTSTFPRYDAGTMEVKTDATISTIPNPTYDGETFVGINGGRSANSFFNPIANSIGFTAYCVVEFQGALWWGGSGAIVRTDYDGNIVFSYTVSGFTAEVYTLCVGDSGNNLYAGGYFDNVNGTTCYSIARIDNAGNVNAYFDNNGFNGVNSRVYSIRDDPVYGGQYYCGDFTSTGTGGLGLYRIAFGQSGSAWVSNAIIDNNVVYDCCRYNDGTYEILLIGGDFTSYQFGNSCQNILGYNLGTASYFPVGSSGSYSDFNGAVKCFTLVSSSSQVFLCGDFTNITGNPYLYSAYFYWSNLQTPYSYDYTAGSTCNTIYFDANAGVMYRGGGAFMSIAGNDYSGSPPFTIGLNIRSPQGFWAWAGNNKTFIPSANSTPNYAYVYSPSTYTNWISGTPPPSSSGTPIVNFGGAEVYNVLAYSTGQNFTLKATLSGTPRWFIVANNGCAFS